MDLAGAQGIEPHEVQRERLHTLAQNLTIFENDTDRATDEQSSDTDMDDTQDETLMSEMKGMADKLEFIYDLHTSQRMKPQPANTHDAINSSSSPMTSASHLKKKVRGVSIPSQRRFVGYWARVLAENDPRPFSRLADSSGPKIEHVRRHILITEIRVHMPDRMPGLPSIISKKRISIHLSRYKSSFVTDLDKKELQLQRLRRLESKLRLQGVLPSDESKDLSMLQNIAGSWKDSEWDDRSSLFESEGVLVEHHHSVQEHADSEAMQNIACRTLSPRLENGTENAGIKVDADRELQLKLLIGDTGGKHSRLPDVVLINTKPCTTCG